MSEQVEPDMLKATEAVQELHSEPEALPEPELDTLLENDADSEITDTLTKLPSESSNTENTEDQSDLDKTTEDDISELTNSRKSRELKSILALSREANLDTNLSRKRKTLEGLKSKESPKNTQPDLEVKKPIKVTNSHNFKFPVTAEAELEQDSQESADKVSSENNSISPSKLKRKRDSLGEAIAGGATDDSHRKNRKRSASELKMFKTNKDIFCWRCHREGVNVVCETCPRSYHQRCLKQTITDVEHWPCPECVAILKAESTHTRSEAMKGMSLEHLCSLLKFALNRMMVCQGSEPFLHPVNDSEFPEYQKYIIQPMDLTNLQNNIKGNHYGSTQAFEADAKWILHNSIIFNSYQSKLTYSAKNIMKICKQEMAEIENCPSCYLNANTKKATWFVEVCPRPHLLVWAKLKGFPFWPAKAMSCTSSGMVDVRFFGAHDRAWVNYKDCFLYSEKDPNTFKQKRYDIEKCVEELNIYIDNLKKVYGEFRHAPYRTPLDPHNMGKQMLISIPKCKSLGKRRKSLKTPEIASPDRIKTEPKTEGYPNTLSEENADEPRADPSEQDKDSREPTKKGYPISEPYSNRTTPARELDTTMEGYGTDDDSVAEIDLERRRAFVDRGSKPDEEDDDDTDTQVPSTVSTDARGGYKARVGSGGTPSGKSSVSQGRKSEVENTQKRMSSEEIFPGQRKTSRRNSDLSVKSDSSLLSNLSDKINRVDISENMEISLGNEDITISDNVSPPNGENSKSSSECSFEHKRKPVQVDIDNAEFTISPSSKLKMSEQLMKRLSDASDKVEEVKKSVFEDKSSTDKLIEKFQGDLKQQDVGDNRPSTSEGLDQEEQQSSLKPQEVDDKAAEGSGDEKNKIMESKAVLSTKETSDIEEGIVTEKVVVENEDDIPACKEVASDGDIVKIDKADVEVEREIVTEKEVVESEEGTVLDAMEGEEGIVSDKEMESEDGIIPEKESLEKNIDKETEAEANLIEMDDSSKEDNYMKPAKEGSTEIIQPAITEFTSTSESNAERIVAETNSGSPKLVNVVESFRGEDEEEEEEKESERTLHIDKKNIFKIIHSSLNRGRTKNKAVRDAKKKRKHEKIRIKFRPPRPKTHSKVEKPKEAASKTEITIEKDAEASKVDHKPAVIEPESPAITKSDSEISESDEPLISKSKKISKSAKSDTKVLKTDDKLPTARNETSLKPAKSCSGVVGSGDKAAESKSEGLIKPSTTPKPDLKAVETDHEAATMENVIKTKHPPRSYSRVRETEDEQSASKSDPVKSLQMPKSNIKECNNEPPTKEIAIKLKDPPKSYSKLTKANDKPAAAKSESAIESKDSSKSEPKSSSSDDKPLKSLTVKARSATPRQKRPSSEEAPVLPPKIIKLVPIDSILHQKEAESPVSSVHNTGEGATETVKSEPNSGEDDLSENENWEAKRQYLSALNISEKTGGTGTNKTPEIRTRAKAEERREKYRKVDNLTKVIDDVALNYMPDDSKSLKTPPRKLERRKSVGGAVPSEGEIYVKSFAKLQTSSGKQRARKTFPTPSYVKPPVRIVVASKKDASASMAAAKKDNHPAVAVSKKDNPIVMTKKDASNLSVVKKPVTTTQPPTLTPISKSHITTFNSNSTTVTSTASTKNAQMSLTPSHTDSTNVACTSDASVTSPVINLMQAPKPAEVNNMTHVILMPTQTINYCSPLGNPFLNTQVAMALPAATTNVSIPPLHQTALKPIAPNIRTSQNYVPQGDIHAVENPSEQRSPPPPTSLLNSLLNQVAPVPEQPERTENATNAISADTNEDNSVTDGGTAVDPMQEDEFAVLNTIIPENVSRAVSDLLLRPPPKLRPRPPSILSGNFDEGIPSSAGDVTTRINSIAHRMTDYFRGMLIETMSDLGRAANPEAKIINLQAEIEALKHKHNLELSEMRQNICTILKDVQRSIVEERERVKNEARASCEAEAIKRIELAKSKQWCANCSKEAQFYCCWNTSYCDYPCQQKHWAQHMGKCTQNIEKTNNASPGMTMSRPAGQPIILRPTAPPKPGVGRIMAKPTKVYLNRAASPQKVFKTVATSGNHITVIETTPGNYELVSNGSMTVPGGAKFYSVGSNVFTKLKTTSNSTPTSATCSSATSGPRSCPGAVETTARGPYTMPVTTVMEED